MTPIQSICLKGFWTYFVFYWATIGLHVAQSEVSPDVNPDYTFKHEGAVILSSELGHLTIEVNVSQVHEGLHIAQRTLKHLKEVAAAVKSQVPTIELLLATATSEISDVQQNFNDLLLFFTAKPSPRSEEHLLLLLQCQGEHKLSTTEFQEMLLIHIIIQWSQLEINAKLLFY